MGPVPRRWGGRFSEAIVPVPTPLPAAATPLPPAGSHGLCVLLAHPSCLSARRSASRCPGNATPQAPPLGLLCTTRERHPLSGGAWVVPSHCSPLLSSPTGPQPRPWELPSDHDDRSSLCLKACGQEGAPDPHCGWGGDAGLPTAHQKLPWRASWRREGLRGGQRGLGQAAGQADTGWEPVGSRSTGLPLGYGVCRTQGLV